MNFNRNDINLFQKAALATLATLVILLSILLAFEIHTKKEHKEFLVLIDEENFDEVKPFKKEIEIKNIDQSIEEMLEAESRREHRKNIAVNKTEEHHTQTEIEENQTEEAYRDQLVKNALGEEDYEKYIENKPTYEDDADIEVPEKETQKKVKKDVYSGPTNIEYSLEGRHNTYIYVPTYLCQGAALVKVKIEVLSSGYVNRAQIDETATKTTSKCHIDAALKAAESARFNLSSKKKQTGTITFRFESQ